MTSFTKGAEGTVPEKWWFCHMCGCKVYLQLRHDCPTAPMIPTRSPYDLNGEKEYPGE